MGRQIPEKKDDDGNVVREARTVKEPGMHVPEVLREYMGTDFLPFVRKARKVAKPKKGGKKKGGGKQKGGGKKAAPAKKAAPPAAAAAGAGAASSVPTAAQLDALLATKSYVN